MQMSLSRRLSEAVGSWLHFEFCCHRAGLFSESALKSAVGQVISSLPANIKGARVYADAKHAGLPRSSNRGRPPSVDFVLVLPNNGLGSSDAEVVVETKWAGSSHCTAARIFRDFVRLALIKHHSPSAKCIFLLAGNNRELAAVLAASPFTSARLTHGISKGNLRKVRLNKFSLLQSSVADDAMRGWQGVPADLAFLTSCSGIHPAPTDGNRYDFGAIAWEIGLQ
ncbi:hypothetical protein FHW18_002632 [Pigmentiphaga litoralis]|uniref:Uncharacterized protein n=1 Tax=Pigmentiphaga litoralis TaxID=516702 RepID=A0A7Y9IUN2_9BURK|nr:hypothetical protein [Pigmentiphaga litoralis]NYE83361.1 hypothetical protein [Pigmentiphaga litoralis]